MTTFVFNDGVPVATSSGSTYASVADGDSYWAAKLHPGSWPDSSNDEKEKALYEASQMISNLAYAGLKAAAYTVWLAGGTDAEIDAADLTQELQFPRGTDTEIPQRVKFACCEIANVLLDSAYDAELELQNLGLVSQGFASVRATYDRTHQQIEHLQAGIPSVVAWRLLKPFLRDARGIRLSRV